MQARASSGSSDTSTLPVARPVSLMICYRRPVVPDRRMTCCSVVSTQSPRAPRSRHRASARGIPSSPPSRAPRRPSPRPERGRTVTPRPSSPLRPTPAMLHPRVPSSSFAVVGPTRRGRHLQRLLVVRGMGVSVARPRRGRRQRRRWRRGRKSFASVGEGVEAWYRLGRAHPRGAVRCVAGWCHCSARH